MNILKKYSQIEIWLSYIIGFPTETEQEMQDTVDLFIELSQYGSYVATSINMWVPYVPGTSLYKLTESDIELSSKNNEWIKVDVCNPNFNPIWINSFTQLQGYGGIEIGSNCGIAGHTMILAESHSYKRVDIPIMNQPLENRKVIIEDNVWIGCNVTILGDVKIGHDSIIGSNSFVNKDIPPFAIVFGTPAKVVKMRK